MRDGYVGAWRTGLDYSRVATTGPTREAAARAVAQNEVANPGDWARATRGRDPEAIARVQGAIDGAIAVENQAADGPRSLPEGIPDTDATGRPVRPSPEGRGLPPEGPPDSRVVGPRGDRLYGPDGRPALDIDWGHDDGQGRPHAHDWNNGIRQPGRPATEDEAFSGAGRGDDGLIGPEDW